MTVEQFIQDIKAAKILVGAGVTSGLIIDGVRALDMTDVDAVTAEAFNQNVFDENVDWSTARLNVIRAISGVAPTEA